VVTWQYDSFDDYLRKSGLADVADLMALNELVVLFPDVRVVRDDAQVGLLIDPRGCLFFQGHISRNRLTTLAAGKKPVGEDLPNLQPDAGCRNRLGAVGQEVNEEPVLGELAMEKSGQGSRAERRPESLAEPECLPGCESIQLSIVSDESAGWSDSVRKTPLTAMQ